MIAPSQDEITKIKEYLNDSYESKFLKLRQYVNIVLNENKKHNLIGSNTAQNIWLRHVIDSLQLLPYFKEYLCKNKKIDNIIDLGSGAGFPGIILSIAIEKQTFLIEKSPVKTKFLENVISELNINAKVINKTITTQNSSILLPKNSIITSRAFKSIAEILDIVDKNNDIKKIFLLKGIKWKEEIEKVEKSIINKWDIDVKNSITGEGVVLLMTKKY